MVKTAQEKQIFLFPPLLFNTPFTSILHLHKNARQLDFALFCRQVCVTQRSRVSQGSAALFGGMGGSRCRSGSDILYLHAAEQ